MNSFSHGSEGTPLFKFIIRFFRRLFHRTPTPTPAAPPRSPSVEPLETRTHLSVTHATPFKKVQPTQVATAYLDNRGRAFMTFTVALDTTTLSKRTAAIYTAGPDTIIGTNDDIRLTTAVAYRKGRLVLDAAVPLNQTYRVILNAAVIKDIYGRAIDGEFNSQGKASGNGVAGGNYDVIAKGPVRTNYRYTVSGFASGDNFINVAMLTKVAPVTVTNFKHYANEGAWDTTWFHRSTTDATSGIQVVQGGGFNLDSGGNIGSVHTHTGVGLELGASNLKGTLAMARTSDPSSNVNQWFFNVNDNTTLNTFGGGYTVFGVVMDAGSQAVIEAINSLAIRKGDPTNSNSPFNEIPSLDPTGPIDVPTDLVRITRVAMLMDQAAPTGGTPFVARPPAATATVLTAAPKATPFMIAAPKSSDSLLD